MPVDYRPIFSGQFIKWNREFGFITPTDRKIIELFTHMSRKRGIYAHISKKIGTNQIKDKYSTKCLFAVGLDPHDYLKEKIYPSALVWILEDELGDIQQYLRSRHEYLSKPNNLQEFLNADWYVNDWKKKAKCNPLRKLELDNQLLLVTENKETNIDTANELYKWLSQKTQSPFFAINEEEKHAILLKGWKNVCLKDNEYFRDFSLNNFSKLCNNKIISTDAISDTLLPELFKANSISVDIESDGKDIYQIGYATTSERKLFDCSKNDFLSEIRETDIAAKEKSHWLVGHNIIAWDLPVLKGKRGNYFSTKIVWDTLLLSWILAPWERTHALVNKEEAHQADSDAKASLDLFYRQINQFPTEYVLELTEKVLEPVEFLFRNPNILFDTGKDRDYPEVPAYLNDDKNKNRSIIIPHWRLAECAWCSNVAFVWPEDHLDEVDCRIDLEALERLAAKDRDIWVRALTVVVRDAEKNNVQVLLRMTPRWLRDRIQRKLQDERCLIKNHITDPEKINITTYFAYHSKDDEIINQTLSSESVSCLFWEEGQFDLRVEPVALDNHYVADIPGLMTPHAGAMFHLNNINNFCRFLSENGLIREKELNGRQIWLTYDPANIRVATSSCWHLHKQRYLPLLQDIEDESNAPIVDQDYQPTAIFPAWTITQYGKHRIFKDFVPPTSTNRVQYWEDALLRLLSLESNQDFEGIYILLVSHPHEKDVVMAALSDYGATIPFEGAPLRHLERLRRGKYRFALDIIARADQWLLASESLDCEIQLVIESLPIYDWWICRSSAAGYTTPFLTDESEEDPTEDAEDEVFDSNQDTGTVFANITKQPGVNKHPNHIILSQDVVQICIERFFKPWMSNTLKGYTPTNLPLILDCRFDQFNFSKSAHFTRRDFAIATLTATQKDQLLRLLREAMGDIERQNAPIDYETYRIFFKEHWGHEDFKQDTQRPAIEAIIPNDSDVLVRLPTGEGKSVLFQVPALVRGLKTQRLTIVITPLRALMADQVRSLWGMGFFQSVDYLSGDRDPWANSEVYQGIIDNRIKLLYIAPERFRVPRFKEALARRLENDGALEYIVVDEAHCMSQWGFEFRPDYLYAISELWRLCRTSEHFSRFLLFSATVTDATRKDIERVTGITAGEYFKIRPEDMPHPIQPFIRLHSEDVQSKLYGADITSARLGFIEKKIKDTDLNRSALIVFVTRRRHAEDLCALLNQSVDNGTLSDNTRIRYFHAGLPALERLEIYEEYNNRNVNVLICTKAVSFRQPCVANFFCRLGRCYEYSLATVGVFVSY